MFWNKFTIVHFVNLRDPSLSIASFCCQHKTFLWSNYAFWKSWHRYLPTRCKMLLYYLFTYLITSAMDCLEIRLRNDILYVEWELISSHSFTHSLTISAVYFNMNRPMLQAFIVLRLMQRVVDSSSTADVISSTSSCFACRPNESRHDGERATLAVCPGFLGIVKQEASSVVVRVVYSSVVVR